MKYFTDEEIFEALETIAGSHAGITHDVIHRAIERIQQKNKQLDFMRERIDTAANIIGHNMISEAMYD